MAERVDLESDVPPEMIEDLQVELDDARLTPEQMLKQLEDPRIPHELRRELVVEAEAMCFAGSELDRLRPLLGSFIEAHRNSNHAVDAIAVGAAARKFIATMPPERLAEAAALLKSGPRATISPGLRLEVVKMIVRHLTANPLVRLGTEPELAGDIARLLDAYLDDHVLPLDKVAATALNAILALALLGSPLLEGTLQRLSSLQSAWFRQLVSRRARQLLDDVRQRDAAAPCLELLNRLHSIAARG